MALSVHCDGVIGYIGMFFFHVKRTGLWDWGGLGHGQGKIGVVVSGMAFLVVVVVQMSVLFFILET